MACQATVLFHENAYGNGMCADFDQCSPDQREAHLTCGYEY